jgi:hypothetical protein
METTINRNLLKYHVQRQMFCRVCKRILDVRSAVSLDVLDAHGNIAATACYCTTCHDKQLPKFQAAAQEKQCTLAMLDGRELFPVRKRKVKA